MDPYLSPPTLQVENLPLEQKPKTSEMPVFFSSAPVKALRTMGFKGI